MIEEWVVNIEGSKGVNIPHQVVKGREGPGSRVFGGGLGSGDFWKGSGLRSDRGEDGGSKSGERNHFNKEEASGVWFKQKAGIVNFDEAI